MKYPIFNETMGLSLRVESTSKGITLLEFEDGVRYSPKELRVVQEMDSDTKIASHTVKKVFGGEILGTSEIIEKRPNYSWLKRRKK